MSDIFVIRPYRNRNKLYIVREDRPDQVCNYPPHEEGRDLYVFNAYCYWHKDLGWAVGGKSVHDWHNLLNHLRGVRFIKGRLNHIKRRPSAVDPLHAKRPHLALFNKYLRPVKPHNTQFNLKAYIDVSPSVLDVPPNTIEVGSKYINSAGRDVRGHTILEMSDLWPRLQRRMSQRDSWFLQHNFYKQRRAIIVKIPSNGRKALRAFGAVDFTSQGLDLPNGQRYVDWADEQTAPYDGLLADVLKKVKEGYAS